LSPRWPAGGGDEGIHITGARQTRFLAKLFSGLPTTWVVVGQADGSLVIRPRSGTDAETPEDEEDET